MHLLKDDLQHAIQAVYRMSKVEKEKEAEFVSEKLKSHAKQLLILEPSIRKILTEEKKHEADQRNSELSTLNRMRDELREVQERNERLMRELYNEKEN